MNKTPAFGNVFKKLRIEKGLTQNELVNLFNKKYYYNFNTSSISMYENNKQIPEVNVLEKWADFFEVSLDYLLGRTDIKNPYKENENTLEIYNRVKEVSDASGITIEELEKETNLRPGTIEEWKYYIPTGDKVQRVAIALGTTMEYILIGENDISPQKKILARKLNKLTEEQLKVIDSMIDALEDTNK